jgi:hypothetical protein
VHPVETVDRAGPVPLVPRNVSRSQMGTLSPALPE